MNSWNSSELNTKIPLGISQWKALEPGKRQVIYYGNALKQGLKSNYERCG